MCKIVRFLFLLLVLITTANIALAEDESKALARGAFYAVENKPFDSRVVRKATEDIKRAGTLNPKEPWVAIATSRAFLEMGYQSGDRYNVDSFEPESLEKAKYYAEQGVLLGPTESIAYCQLVRIQIILKDYRGALETLLNHAVQQDKSNFYPPYLRTVVYIRVNNKEMAKVMIAEAERRATEPYQRRFVFQDRIKLACLLGDKETEELYYRKLIELDPQDANPYGNYGKFLLSQKRYDEAITNLEKALSISPYPLAERELRKARLLRDSTSK